MRNAFLAVTLIETLLLLGDFNTNNSHVPGCLQLLVSKYCFDGKNIPEATFPQQYELIPSNKKGDIFNVIFLVNIDMVDYFLLSLMYEILYINHI